MKGADLLARGGALRFVHGVNGRARMQEFLSDRERLQLAIDRRQPLLAVAK